MTVQGIGPAPVTKWLAQWRPDLVHLTNPAHVGIGIAAACRRLDIPLIITTHDFWWVCPKATLLRPDGTICPGRRVWSECIRCLAGSDHQRWVRQLARLPDWAAGLTLAAFYANALTRHDPSRSFSAGHNETQSSRRS